MANGFNVLSSFQQGLQIRGQLQAQDRNQRIQQLRNTLAEKQKERGFEIASSPELQELAALDSPEAGRIAATFGALSKSRQESFFQDAKKGLNLLNAGDTEGAFQLASRRDQQIQKLGGDNSDTQAFLQTLGSGDISGAVGLLQEAVETGIDLGFLKDPEEARIKREQRLTSSERNFNRFQELIQTAQRTGDPADRERAEQFGRQSRFVRPTEQQSADIKVEAAERREVAKANVKRTQGFVDSGVAAADSTANIRRSLNLLDGIKTGGFAAFKLRASQIFGIEGADEAELSANLGKNVLAQLKPLFGAAFTAAEGERLERIEARFGKSTAANKRLLEQVLRIAERASRRGIAAAEKVGDDFTAGEIRNALSFKLEEKAIGAPSVQPQGLPTVQPGGVLRFDAQGNLIP